MGRKRKKKQRGQHGGHREGAGRPLGIRGMLARGLFTRKQVYVYEPVVIMTYHHGQSRRMKTTRGNLALDRLENLAIARLRWWGYFVNHTTTIESAGSYEKAGDELYKVCKYLSNKDRVFRLILTTILPRRTPTPFRNTELEYEIAKLEKLQKKRLPIEERLAQISTERRAVEMEERVRLSRARRAGNISESTFNKIKAARSGASAPFNYQYRRPPIDD